MNKKFHFILSAVFAVSMLHSGSSFAQGRLRDRINRGLDHIENQLSNGENSSPTASTHSTTKGRTVAQSSLNLPASKLIYSDNFSTTGNGSFPANWNTNAGGEITNISGNNEMWLQLSKKSVCFPEGINVLPENFIVQFDLYASNNYSANMSGLKTVFVKNIKNRASYNQDATVNNQVYVDVHPAGDYIYHYYNSTDAVGAATENESNVQRNANDPLTVTFIKQGQQLKVYVDDDKVWDLPRAFQNGLNYSLLFANYSFEGALYISNLRVSSIL